MHKDGSAGFKVQCKRPKTCWSLLMRHEFTAIVERDGPWFVSYCPELPGANGQGASEEESLESLRDAIALILEDRREDGLRGVPDDAHRTIVTIE
jgi:predicted RNase H-like HicB family nuclease